MMFRRRDEMRQFTVTYENKNYILDVKPNETMMKAWIRIRSRFRPGSTITIVDDKNNMMTFKKE